MHFANQEVIALGKDTKISLAAKILDALETRWQ